MADGYSTPVKKTKDVINVPPSPFLKRLGYGTGVSVYALERSPIGNKIRSPWAIKMINKTHKNTVYGTRLQKEANLLRKLDHPYIVGFRAFAKNASGENCLAMEKATISLADLIEKRGEESSLAFPPAEILKMGSHIAKALDYLHIRMLILHCDIKSHNVLVIGDFEVCKLCDFGVSLPLTRSGKIDIEKAGQNATYTGTLSWTAPEILQNPTDPDIVTTKADIYSYGLVIWEMIALDIPHASEDISEELLDDDSDANISLEEISLFESRPPVPYEIIGNLDEYNYPLEIYYCCTEKNPKYRPSAYHLALSIYDMTHEDN